MQTTKETADSRVGARRCYWWVPPPCERRRGREALERVEDVHAAGAAAAVAGIALEAHADGPGTVGFGFHGEAEVDDGAVALEARRIKRGGGARELQLALGLAVEDVLVCEAGVVWKAPSRRAPRRTAWVVVSSMEKRSFASLSSVTSSPST